MYTCAGANSVPVCVSPQDREASKSNAVCWPFIAPCCGFIPSDAPSPLRTPEDSQTYEHISRSILPVSARPVSVCQLPTFSDVTPVQARKGAVRHKNSSRDTEIDDGRLSDICGSCFLCLTLVNIVSTVSYWCTNVCHIYYNTVCVAGIMQRDIPF